MHLQTTHNNKPIRRSYSIASSPHEETIHITIRVQEQGTVSPQLAKLQEKDKLIMIGPFGDFRRGEEEHTLFIAAGSGITPCISYLREAQQKNDTRAFTLLYTNKTTNDLLYHEELSQIQKNWFTYQPTLTREEWEEKNGRITKQEIKKHLTENTVVYLCGSNAFIRAMNEHLQELNIPSNNIRVENYGNITS